jgi:hypothetical protein
MMEKAIAVTFAAVLLSGCAEPPGAAPGPPRPKNVIRLPAILLSQSRAEFARQSPQGELKLNEPSLCMTELICEDAASRAIARSPMVLDIVSVGGRQVVQDAEICKVSDGENADDGIFAIEATIKQMKRAGRFRVRVFASDRIIAETDLVAKE